MAAIPPTPAPSKALVLVRRAGSTLLLWGLVGAAFASMQKAAYLALITVLTVLSTMEYFRMLRSAGVRGFPRFGILLATAYCLLLHAGFYRGGGVPAGLDCGMLCVAVIGAFMLQLREPIHGLETLLAVTATLCGFVYIAFLFNFAAKLLFVVPAWQMTSGMVAAPAACLLLWLLAVTKLADMGAYLVGSMLGRHKMIPHVSAGKTWEGLGGAMGASQAAGCGLYAWFPQQLAVLGGWGHVIFLSFILALLAVLGDLAESVVKRTLMAKDSGRLLPGIGGTLDLIDSLCFTAPALYFYLQWVLLPGS
ncbi:MAG: phosphatidate cytidylyltransferase [Verrucomicrobia bacterium]|nr:phosphatidate cytidylyltransferase [Verrucomicrobiota bacterium]